MIRDPDERRAYDRARYHRNKARVLAKRREYYERNREAVRARQSDYYQQNRETILAQQAAHKAATRPYRPPRLPNLKPKRAPKMLIGVVQSSPLPGREPGPPPKPAPSKPVWEPVPINTRTPPPPRPTTYLCSCGLPFPTKERANRHERTHPHVAPYAPLGPEREVSVLGL